MKNIFKLLNLTTALTVSVIASDTALQGGGSPAPRPTETQEWFVVEHQKKTERGKEEAEDKYSWYFLEEEDYAVPAVGGVEGAPHGKVFKVQGAEYPAVEELDLISLSQKQENCLKHFFKTRKIASYADVKENWNVYFSHMSRIIENLIKQNGDTDTLGEKQVTLLKCDTLMRDIEEEMFDKVCKECVPSSN